MIYLVKPNLTLVGFSLEMSKLDYIRVKYILVSKTTRFTLACTKNVMFKITARIDFVVFDTVGMCKH